VLENHCNGELLDASEVVLGFARTMTWNGKNPTIELVNEVYPKGVRLSAAEMNVVEQRVSRDADLGKWLLDIDGRKPKPGKLFLSESLSSVPRGRPCCAPPPYSPAAQLHS
jgi:hypothetical protein